MAKKAQNQEEITPMGCALTVLVIGGIMLWSGTKLWGAIVLAVGGVLTWLVWQSEKQKTMPAAASPFSNTIETSTDSDEYAFSIKGINFCGIDDSMLGDFAGTARALKSNPHDPYAIGIYRGSKRVGFLPKGNKELHDKIMAVGGSVDADGYIAKDKEDGRTFYYGKVNLLGI